MPPERLSPAIVILSDAAMPVAETIRNTTGGVIHGARKRVTAHKDVVLFDDAKAHLQALFLDRVPIVAVMASGAVIRILAPLLAAKADEPPVIAVAEDGHSVVPLLGGHHGANGLAQDIAFALGGMAAVTTAGDLRFGVALDAPPEGYVLANPANAKAVMAELLAGARAVLDGEAAWITGSGLPLAGNGSVALSVTDERREPHEMELVYHPRRLAVGIGCERGCDPEEAVALARKALADAGLAEDAVGVVCSLDLKADEAAVHDVAERLGVPARFFDAATLEAETPRLKNPSDTVFAEVGCHGVAEGAALAAAGPDGELIVAKRKSSRATCAIARAPQPFTAAKLPGRARGTLHVVGIGPGSEGWRSPEVSRMVTASTDLVGYSLYLDLLGPLAAGKQRHDFDLGREEDRVRHAMELAGQGREVALVCSGDAGIYAMATLVFELLDKGGVSDAARRIDIRVSPGISALQAAAARAGAPLGHDFCTISLSDLLTPWEDIQRRVRAAGEGDFVVAFYNPVSKKRRTQLAWARDELLKHRPAQTPVILATNLGREGEHLRIVPLGELDVDDVDMLTVVVVGSSDSRTVETGDGKRWVYTPRGYSGKTGTKMGDGQ
ncbi:precorrin-3B C(17)-methyltransferase [Oricola thermophila]|uniref:Precorrin-3B C(17)-methyltransferase n=1 Tax=Oricola thermophila TaxID=2742145 RepID=A0A6N1VA53_9HYPH|nr:precorrin-3B C(17)-methyltransferase [Oricola thermophila]QKV17403.1 precorrin-3B C(17)-methyltransferase [Oricola thermophila]